MMRISSSLVALSLCCLATAASDGIPNAGSLRQRHHRQHRQLVNNDDPEDLWGLQTGPANQHSDAGSMIYDYKRNELILTGTTHDTEFFAASQNYNGVDCFVLTIELPNPNDEITTQEVAIAGQELAEQAAGERVPWKLNGKHRVATPNILDRCDLITTVYGETHMQEDIHDHTFIGGTLSINTMTNSDGDTKAAAVQPLLYETTLGFGVGQADDMTQITTGPPLKVFEAPPVNPGGEVPIAIPKKNDIIIPAQMTTHQSDIYIATIHRILVIGSTEASNSNPKPKYQISLGLSKFNMTNNPDMPLQEEWEHILGTSILETKNTGVPHVTSGMFHPDEGSALSPAEQLALENEQNEIEEEINAIEEEQEEYMEEEMQLDMHRHEYQNDGVLISGLEYVEMGPSEAYLLVAGSAPGTANNKAAKNSTITSHPFLDNRGTTFLGDWDGYVAKVSPETGEVVRPVDLVHNDWSFRLSTEPKRNDFIQSICVPKIPPGILTNDAFYTNVVYAVGTTQGKVDGDAYGGAFLLQIDLESMNVLWKKQITGMNVHGMACQVLVDVASHGTTTRADSRDLIYVAGEVHGHMRVTNVGDDNLTYLTHANGETDVWVAQFRASDGKMNWIQQIGTDQQDRLAKTINNPSVAGGVQESDIGDTGSGSGALVLDREGNAIIYGTTNGSLGRTKQNGNRFRDIFVVRLHRDDGSYKSLMTPHKVVTDHTQTSAPGSSSSGSTRPPGHDVQGSDATKPIVTTTTEQKHNGATVDSSVNGGIIAAGFLIPVVLGIIILLATNRKSPNRREQEMTPTKQQPAAQEQARPESPPAGSFPPVVVEDLPEEHPDAATPAPKPFIP